MPFKSKSQIRKFRAMEASGELPKGTTDKWLAHTENAAKLPEHKKSTGKRKKTVKQALADLPPQELFPLLCKLAVSLYPTQQTFTGDVKTRDDRTGNQYTNPNPLKTTENLATWFRGIGKTPRISLLDYMRRLTGEVDPLRASRDAARRANRI